MQASSLADAIAIVGQGLAKLKEHLQEARQSTDPHLCLFVSKIEPVADLPEDSRLQWPTRQQPLAQMLLRHSLSVLRAKYALLLSNSNLHEHSAPLIDVCAWLVACVASLHICAAADISDIGLLICRAFTSCHGRALDNQCGCMPSTCSAYSNFAST